MSKVIKPQIWYQEKALSCPADIVFGWWSAWAGKTFTLLLEPIKGFCKANFRWVIFRKTMTQIKWGWWLWNESENLYQNIAWSHGVEWSAKWVFRRNNFKWRDTAELKFSHLEHEKDKFAHQWLQYAFIWFDELTHFSKSQFLYLMSRNRSTCWIKPFIRATCNPDPESWVASFIERYLDEDWYIRKDRDWVIRYFTMDKDNPVWWNTKQEVIDQCPHIFQALIDNGEDVNNYIKSFTFIEWSLDENKELLSKDPTYKANLIAQDEATKHALLHKCWKPLQDNMALVDYQALSSITTNYLEDSDKYYISVDVAWFGKDLAVIFVWKWFEIIRIKVYSTCNDEDLKEAIESERKFYKIPSHNVVYDNDWLGWWLSSMNYTSFNWWSPAMEYNWVKENYKNLKTQCYYHIIEDYINKNLMKVTTDNIIVDWFKRDYIDLKNKRVKIVDLIKEDIKAIKRAKIDQEWKKCINAKEEQKNILWRSPDFWDTTMMRFSFELSSKKTLIII